MRTKQMFRLASLCCAVLSCAASHEAKAEYAGIGVKLHSTVSVGGTLRWVWRVYAVFNASDDYLVGVYGDEEVPLAVRSLNPAGTNLGSNFFEMVDSGMSSYGSIGDYTFNPDPLNLIGVNSYVDDDISWSTPGPVQQGQAAWGLQANFTNGGTAVTGWGVVLMQLTVNAGHNVEGTVNLTAYLNEGESGPPQANFVATNQVFTSVVPTPASMALLAVAGMIGRSRRRS